MSIFQDYFFRSTKSLLLMAMYSPLSENGRLAGSKSKDCIYTQPHDHVYVNNVHDDCNSSLKCSSKYQY